MSQIKTNEFEGDSSFGRHVNIGGNQDVKGSAHIHKNLRVEGWLDARNIKGPNKGIFYNEGKLNAAYPMPHQGWWALVGKTLPATLYIADGGVWVNTGTTAGNPTIDMQEYQEAVEQLDKDTDELKAGVNANKLSIEQIRTLINTINLDLQNHNGEITSLKTRVSSSEGRLSRVEGRLTDSESNARELSNRIDTLDREAGHCSEWLAANGILPVDGEWSGTGTVPQHGVWLVPSDVYTGEVMFASYGDTEFYGFAPEDYNTDSVANNTHTYSIAGRGLFKVSGQRLVSVPEEVYEVLEFEGFLDTLSAAEGASEAAAQSASGPSKAAPDSGFQEFKYPVYFVKDIRAFVRQERKLIVGGGHSLIYVKTWSGCERFGTPGDNGVIPVAGKVYIDTSSSLSYRMGEVSETIDGVESHYADLVPLGLRTGKTAGTAFDGAAGEALKGRTQWLEARTGALRVLPFDGEYFDGGATPSNGIYYHRIARDDSGEFLCFGQTTFADYGLSEDDYAPNKIPYQLYVRDNELYRVREDTGIMESFTDVAEMQNFIDRWNEAWKIGGVQYGKYDPDNAPDAGHPFQGNGLWMTYEEAIPILELAPFCRLEFGDDSFKYRFRFMGQRGTYNPRTLVPFNLYSVNAPVGSADYMFEQWVDTNLEVLVFHENTPPNGVRVMFTSYKKTFSRCKNLHTIKGLSLRGVSNSNNTAGMFDYCAKLQNLTASFLNCDVSLKDSPLLTRESIVYLVQYASNTKPITVTVHPDVYAKLTGDTTNAAAAALSTEEAAQWQQLVTDAAAKKISFATV